MENTLKKMRNIVSAERVKTRQAIFFIHNTF